MSVITSGGLSRALELLSNDITHIAIGTGAAPGESDLSLPGESQRKAATSIIDGNTLIKEGYWDENEGNGITYINSGLLCDGATDTLGTGTLFGGGEINALKDKTQSLTVSIEITVEAVNY